MKSIWLAFLACMPLAAHADDISKVNKSVRIEAGMRADDVSTANGSIRIEEGATVEDVHTVNGSINLGKNVTAGRVESVNGSISPTPEWMNRNTRVPRVVIGPGAVVNGELRFEREVQLFVSDSATIGNVTGATVRKFSGEKP